MYFSFSVWLTAIVAVPHYYLLDLLVSYFMVIDGGDGYSFKMCDKPQISNYTCYLHQKLQWTNKEKLYGYPHSWSKKVSYKHYNLWIKKNCASLNVDIFKSFLRLARWCYLQRDRVLVPFANSQCVPHTDSMHGYTVA